MARKKITIRTISTISTLLIIVSLCFSLSAQQKPGDQKVLIGGKTYTLYTAKSGDSPFGIARKFGITLDELNRSNPDIKAKLNAGQTVRIPVAVIENKPQTVNEPEKADSEDDLFIYHSVRKRETVFSIAQKSKVTSEDIYYNNPQSRDGIKEGDILKIPKPQTFPNELKTAANETQQPIKYVVGRRETLYSISNKYNVTQEAILKMNPTVRGTLKKGTVLLIPVGPVLAPGRENPKGEERFSLYQIVNGDNFFQLQKRFGCPEEELIQLNPTLKTGVKVGMIIKIPLRDPVGTKNGKTSQALDSLKNLSLVSHPDLNKTFEIGVFLPFCQNLNDSSRIAPKTASFLEFYSGILLATEKLSEAGMKLKLFVYDTYQDNKVVEKLVKKPEFLSLDLIIGPVYPDNQKIVAELSGKNHIPMVSPLSSDSRFVSKTPGYYQINPGRSIRVAGTADFIAEKFDGQNIIVLNHGTNSDDVKLITDRLNAKLGAGKFRQYNILSEGTTGLEGMLDAEKENIIVLAESNEANVSVSMTRLNTISKSNKITVIGLQEYTKMQSIDLEHLHNTRLHYLSPYYIDYRNPKVIAFIEKYRSAFGGEPTQYSFQGYDIALHFMASLGKSGKNFPASNPVPGVDLLQADYSFQKLSTFGGFMNQTFYIVEYTDNYEVLSAGKIRGAIVTDNGEGNEKNGLDQ
jgi:LysM repeat protein